MRRAILVASCVSLVVACKKTQDGLQPATDWQASAAASAGASDEPAIPPPIGMGRTARSPHGGRDMAGDPDNPHAGLDIGGGDPDNPHAGLDIGGGDRDNPHAGLDMGGGDRDNPHAGAGMDVTRLGLAAPDPDRPIDPTHRVTGVLSLGAQAKGLARPGTAVFLTVKRAGPNGEPVGSPLAVDKLTWSGDSVAFELTDAQAMIAGTELAGDVIVSARYDQDGEALSKQPGDIAGQVRLKIPADHVKLTLDTVLP